MVHLPDISFRKVTLKNGLDVIARRQGPLPIASVNLWYHVGSKDEERRQRGFAHLFEHLMFEGSAHYPGDFFKPLQRLGAGVNGSTSSDRTNYFVDVPVAHVELALAMESDRMGHLLPALTDEKLRVQKDVVKNEYRQNYANRSYGQVWRLLAEALYPPSHPYSWTTIGVMEDVEAATRSDVEGFFRRFYVPGNASLSIVGDIDEDEAIALADRYFGDLPGGAPALPPWVPSERLGSDRPVRLYDRVELDRIYEAWPTVPLFHEDDAPLALLGDILGRGRSSRLYRSLVVEREIAQGVTAHQSGRELAGSFSVIVTLRPGRSHEAAREAVLAEIEAIATNGVGEDELERVRNGRVAGFLYALDNVGGFGGVADRLNAYNIYRGDPGRIVSDVERYRRATSDDLRLAAKAYLAGRPRVALEVLGRKPAAARLPLDRSARPASAVARPYRAPLPEVRELACGASLWVLPRRDLPIVAATAVVPAGASSHGPSRGGLADLTAAMLDEGTERRTSHQIALEAEGLGTSLSTSCGVDGGYVGFQSLTPHLEASLDLALDVLLRPTFPEEEWSRVRGQALAGLRSERDSAEARASRGLLRELFPAGHPYRVPVDGEEASVEAITRDDLVRFHAEHYGPSRAAWIIAGDVDPDEVKSRLDGLLNTWGGTGPQAEPPALPMTTNSRPKVVLLDRPGAAQAVVRVGQVGVARGHDDYLGLLLFNQVLGGQFTSRLNETLRERDGLTYGIRSHFDFRRGAGPFTISAGLQADRLAEALSVLRHEVLGLLDDRPPTAEELDDARRSLIEGQARHFETPSALVARYASLFVHGLPSDEHRRFPERLEGVGLGEVLEAARRHLRPESFVYVVVADAAVVSEGLERLPWADLERLA